MKLTQAISEFFSFNQIIYFCSKAIVFTVANFVFY